MPRVAKKTEEGDEKKIPGTDKYITRADPFYRNFQDGVKNWESQPNHPPTITSYIGALMIMPKHSEAEFPPAIQAKWNEMADPKKLFKGNRIFSVVVTAYRQFAHSVDMPDGRHIQVPITGLQKVKKRIRLGTRIGGLEKLDYEVLVQYKNSTTTQVKRSKPQIDEEEEEAERSAPKAKRPRTTIPKPRKKAVYEDPDKDLDIELDADAQELTVKEEPSPAKKQQTSNVPAAIEDPVVKTKESKAQEPNDDTSNTQTEEQVKHPSCENIDPPAVEPLEEPNGESNDPPAMKELEELDDIPLFNPSFFLVPSLFGGNNHLI
ncbi:hypothetical protein F5Y01DRAFT_79561 [Xylaria sp. FL0043]|nr:hypothetical protein F5Y01DRAFT_79561 [Xylaria sp. FL0043]